MGLGVTRIYPGQIGVEYYMTKGHFHKGADQPEIYFCVRGEGFLLSETRDGDFEAVPWKAGTIRHVPTAVGTPRGQHRHQSVGLCGKLCAWPAGHDYAPILARGFARIVVEQEGVPQLVPNPRRR
jgi:glucose-6-phosphate isomerase